MDTFIHTVETSSDARAIVMTNSHLISSIWRGEQTLAFIHDITTEGALSDSISLLIHHAYLKCCSMRGVASKAKMQLAIFGGQSEETDLDTSSKDEDTRSTKRHKTIGRILRLQFDGGARPQNGHGAGSWVCIEDGEETSGAKYLGNNIKSNFAEYQGLILGLEHLLTLGLTKEDQVEVKGDSMLVIQQTRKIWKCNEPTLQVLLAKVQRLIERIPAKLYFEQVPRAQNKRADQLCTECIKREAKAVDGK